MRNLKRFLITIFLLQFVFLSIFYVESSASSEKSDIKIYSPSCILMESSTGKVLYEKNANEVRYPASTTKIMTAILVLENCELDDVATVSHNAIYSIPADYVTSNLREGEELTIEQLLNVLLIPSANDAAIVLAEHVSGSVAKFADLMNEKAKELGCKNTHFVNPNGIHNKEHVSTSYDLALITKYAMENSKFREIIKKTKYTLPATNKYKKADRTFKTTNNLLLKDSEYYYSNCIGVKTGYTGEAGNCLVSAASKDGMEVIAVVLGGEFTNKGLSEKFLDSIELLDYAFDNYSVKPLQESGSIVKEVEISGATKETKNLKVAVKEDINAFMANGTDIDAIEPEITLNDLTPPVSVNSVVGKITYNIDGVTYSSDLIAQSDVLPSRFLPILLHILLILVTLYLIYLLLRLDKNKKGNSYKKAKAKKGGKHGKKGGNFRYTTISNF